MITDFSKPGPTTIAYERRLSGDPRACWQAYTEPAIVRRWLGRGDFVTCRMDIRQGGGYEWVWQLPGFRLRLHGDVLQAEAPRLLITREWMSDMDAPPTRNVVEFEADESGTIMRGLIECDTEQLRDGLWATGMADGMEESFARLDAILRG